MGTGWPLLIRQPYNASLNCWRQSEWSLVQDEGGGEGPADGMGREGLADGMWEGPADGRHHFTHFATHRRCQFTLQRLRGRTG